MAAQAVCPAALAPATGASTSSAFPLRSFSGLKATAQPAARTSLASSLSLKPRPAPAQKVQTSRRAVTVSASSSDGTYKVAVLGAAGGIGQPLSLLIKMSPLVSELRLYDIANVKGVAADLSHCNTPASVRGP